ncbi:MAG: murein transglycosylase [Rhodobacteraceae bacterium]|nr:murein transglycosylase [Paracoccaceae bacterium]
MRGWRWLCACLWVAVMPGAAPAQMLRFADLPGWQTDDHLAALRSFLVTCDQLTDADWQPICRVAATATTSQAAARNFFELFFRPVQLGTGPALFTGYYEPELTGSPVRDGKYAYPIYRRPPELQDGAQYLSRSQIEGGALRGRGLEIAWLDDPVEVYFLQVQGSGRIRLPGGRVIRVGYAGANGFGYRSVGQEMIRRGTLTEAGASAQAIKDAIRASGNDSVLDHNPSYVFFRKLDIPADQGPLGAMGRSITPLRSVAVDPAYTPLGAPVWVEKTGPLPLHQLMVAQDTGGAIKGAQRADIYYGTGPQAGDLAGNIKDGGRLIALLPIEAAFAATAGE